MVFDAAQGLHSFGLVTLGLRYLARSIIEIIIEIQCIIYLRFRAFNQSYILRLTVQ